MGTIKAVTPTQVTVAVDGLDTVYKARSDVSVIVNNIPGSWSQLKVGDQATFVVSGGLVFHISLTQSVPSLVEGEGIVTAVYPTQVQLSQNGATEIFNVSRTAHVFRNGQDIALTELVPGDRVRIHSENRLVTFLTVTEPAKELPVSGTLQGVYVAHSFVAGRIVEISVKTEANGIDFLRNLQVSPDVTIIGGTAANFSFDQTKLEMFYQDKIVTIIRIIP